MCGRRLWDCFFFLGMREKGSKGGGEEEEEEGGRGRRRYRGSGLHGLLAVCVFV
jgi:hypothetical protein